MRELRSVVGELRSEGVDVSTRPLPDGVVVAACDSKATPIVEVAKRISGAGFHAETFTTGRRFSLWLNDSMRDPMIAVGKLWGATPWLMATTPITFLAIGCIRRRFMRVARSDAAVVGLWRMVLLGAGVGVLAFCGSSVVERAQGWLGVEATEQPWVERAASGGAVGIASLVLIGVGLAPLAEEIFFRGYVLASVSGVGGRLLGYVVSTGLFAVVHGNPSALPSYVWSGLVLAWSYDRWRSLSVPVVAHAFANAVAIALLLRG